MRARARAHLRMCMCMCVRVCLWAAQVVSQDGVTVLIEPKALMHIIGTRMDYVEDRIRSEFTFDNPNAAGSCGCGESFNPIENPLKIRR